MRFLRELSRRPFVRNVITVATGTALAQAVTLAFAPLITRLFGPEVFGLQSVFLSLVGVLAVVAALGYPLAIVLPARDDEAAVLARLSLALAAAFALGVALLLAWQGETLLQLLHAGPIAPVMGALPLALFAAVMAAVLAQWLIRRRAFALGARFGVLNAFLLNGAKAGLGLWLPTAWVLILTHAAVTFAGTLWTWLAWRRQEPADAPGGAAVAPPDWRALARRYRDFPLLRTPQNLINAVSQSLPVLLLAAAFGSGAAGQYALAAAVLAAPASLIGGSVMSVFTPRINEAIQRGEDARSLIVRATRAMALAGALPFAALALLAPPLFAFVFGAQWHTAGVYAQWLAPWMFLQYVNTPAVSAIPALRLQGGLLVYELFSTGSKVVALVLGWRLLASDVAAVALFSAAGCIAYLWLILWVIRRSGAGRHG